MLSWARVPWLFFVGSYRLSVEFDFCVGEVSISNSIDLLINPIDFTLEYRDSSKDKVFVFFPVGIAGLVNVEQVHKTGLALVCKRK